MQSLGRSWRVTMAGFNHFLFFCALCILICGSIIVLRFGRFFRYAPQQKERKIGRGPIYSGARCKAFTSDASIGFGWPLSSKPKGRSPRAGSNGGICSQESSSRKPQSVMA